MTTRGHWERLDPNQVDEKNPSHIDLFRDAQTLLDEADPGMRGSGGKGRFYGPDSCATLGGVVHGVGNFVFGQGQWSIRSKFNPLSLIWWRPADKTTGVVQPRFTSAERPSTNAAMKNVAAWRYAADHMWLPPYPKSGDDYEWCHLLAHGFSGPTNAANLIAGSHACNSVMCAIEQWIASQALKRPMNQRVWLRVTARIAKGAPDLAETVTYTLYKPGTAPGAEFYSYTIDARRAVEPSKAERRQIIAAIEKKFR